MPRFSLKTPILMAFSAIFFVLGCFFLPANAVHAELDLHESFLPAVGAENDNHVQEYKTDAATIKEPVETGGSYAVFTITIGPNGEGVGNVMWDDTGIIVDMGGWEPLYADPDDDTKQPEDDDESPSPGGGGNYGVYLDIGTSHNVENFNYLDPYSLVDIIATNKIDVVNDIKYTVALTPTIFSDPNSFNGGIATIKFNKIGLDLNTTYYAQIRLLEKDAQRGGASVDSKALSKVYEFKTKESLTALDGTITEGGAVIASDDASNPPIINAVKCNVNPLTWTGCFVHFFYYTFFLLSAFLMRVAGGMMDVFLNISISSQFYQDNSFINAGWKLVRDLVNIFFIISLIWVALSLILGLGDGHSNPYKKIATVLIIAVLINFSLFFSKIIVDAGNATARIFYNAVSITGVQEPPMVNSSTTGLEQQDFSKGVSKGLNMAKIVNSEAQEKLKDMRGTNSAVLLILLLGVIIHVVAGLTFLGVAIAFVGRVGGIWLAMILSPLAFASKIIPGGDALGEYSLKAWATNLLKMSFMAPIFLFFMYLIILIIQADFVNGLLVTNSGQDYSFWQFITAIFVQVLIVLGLLQKSKKLSLSLAGETATAITKGITGALTATAMIAAGGAAFAGRTAIARTANAAEKYEAKRKASGAPISNNVFRQAQSKLGGKIISSKEKVQEKHGAEHKMDEAAQKIYGKDAKFDKLNDIEKKKVKQQMDDDRNDRIDDERSKAAKKMFGKKAEYSKLSTQEQAAVNNAVSNDVKALKRIGDKINDIEHKAEQKIGLSSQAAMAAGKGSYDIRDFPVNKYTALPVGLVRQMFKGMGVEVGKAQKDVFKDFGDAIKKAIESADIKIDTGGGGGGGKKSDGHGGGGGGHH